MTFTTKAIRNSAALNPFVIAALAVRAFLPSLPPFLATIFPPRSLLHIRPQYTLQHARSYFCHGLVRHRLCPLVHGFLRLHRLLQSTNAPARRFGAGHALGQDKDTLTRLLLFGIKSRT